MENVLYYTDNCITIDEEITNCKSKFLNKILSGNKPFDLVYLNDEIYYKNNYFYVHFYLSKDIKYTEQNIKDSFGDLFISADYNIVKINFISTHTPVPPEIYYSEISYLQSEVYQVPYYEWYMEVNLIILTLKVK